MKDTKRPVTLAEKMVAKLVTLGFSKRKAENVARGLIPVARAAIKAETNKRERDKAKRGQAKDAKSATVKDDYLAEKAENVDPNADIVASEIEIAGEKYQVLNSGAVRVNGHNLRLDLSVAPMKGERNIQMLRVMDGWTTNATYLVAAVKGEEGIVAIRSFGNDSYNVKFYPDMAFWGKDQTSLASLGATNHLKRAPYERMYFNAAVLDQLLLRLQAEAAPKKRLKAALDRMMAITIRPLQKAFSVLHTRGTKSVAA